MNNPVAHGDAWSLEDRRAMMRYFVAGAARRGTLDLIDPAHVAATFGGGMILACEVEAEILKYPIELEDGGK